MSIRKRSIIKTERIIQDMIFESTKRKIFPVENIIKKHGSISGMIPSLIGSNVLKKHGKGQYELAFNGTSVSQKELTKMATDSCNIRYTKQRKHNTKNSTATSTSKQVSSSPNQIPTSTHSPLSKYTVEEIVNDLKSRGFDVSVTVR